MRDLNKLELLDKIIIAISITLLIFIVTTELINADECDIGMQVLGDCIAQYDANESNQFVMYSLMLEDFNLTSCK